MLHFKYLTVKCFDREFIGESITRVLNERVRISLNNNSYRMPTVVAIVPRMTTERRTTEVEIILLEEE